MIVVVLGIVVALVAILAAVALLVARRDGRSHPATPELSEFERRIRHRRGPGAA